MSHNVSWNLLPSAFRSTFAFALLGALILCLASVAGAPTKIAFAAGTVTGTVYRDYDADGTRDTREPGLGGVTIKAFNAAGDVVQTTTSYPVCVAANSPVTGCTGVNTPAPGTYTLPSMPSGQYRIEFTTSNTGLKPGAYGTNNGTTVQFVDVTGGNVTNVNASFNSPRDYCQNNPRLATPCYIQGDQSGTDSVLYSHDYTDSSYTASPSDQLTESFATQIGSTWGLAYRSTTNTLYAAAYLKRNAGFDQTPSLLNRPGQIYSLTPGGAADGTPFVVIPNAGGTASTDLHSDFSSANADADFDNEAFPLVGKRSLGDIELNADESLLYVVNMNDRHLYEVNLGTSAVTDRGLIPNPTGVGNEGCTTRGVGRPFGLGWRDDLLYVGGVCTGETGGTAADLQAYVYSFNPATNSFSASPVIQFSLNYYRQCINIGTGGVGLPTCKPGIPRPFAAWHPWTDTYGTIVDINGAGANDTYSNSTGNGGYPMPMLSDIVFDGNDMILGFRDRNGDMIGNNDPGPTQTQTSPTLNTTGAGDILRASPNSSGGWTIENNSQSNPAGIFGPGPGQDDGQGPPNGCTAATATGCGEFYSGDNHNNHDETTIGGLAQVPGFDEVVSTVLDPDVTGVHLFAGGTLQLSNIDDHPNILGTNNEGQRVRGVELYYNTTNANRFAKANGLGDLEALCNAAPLEIGNRIWRDADGDGIQDPGEMVLAGVTVQLWADTNGDSVVDTQVGTVVTDANGQYYFGGVNNTNLTTGSVSKSIATGNDDAEQAGTTVTLNSTILDLPQTNTSVNQYVGLRFQSLNIPKGATITSATIQFDATASDAGTPVNMLIVGENTASAAIFANTANNISSRATTTAGVAWTNVGAWTDTFTTNAQTPDLSRVVQEIVNRSDWAANNNMAFIITDLNDSSGATAQREAASFEDGQTEPQLSITYAYALKTGTAYQVRIDPTAGNNANLLNGLALTTQNAPDSSAGDSGANADARDSDATTASGNYVINLTSGGAGNNNHTLDFGFAPKGSIGNRVWYDEDSNGYQDEGEDGIPNVTVTLFDSAGNSLGTKITDNNGNYLFTGLGAGTYFVRVTSGITSGLTQTTIYPSAGVDLYNQDQSTGVKDFGYQVVLGAGKTNLTADFGYNWNPTNDVNTGGAANATAALGDRVWIDANNGANTNTANGRQDPGEVGVSGAVVTIYGARGADNTWGTADDVPYTTGGYISTRTTDQNGYYMFDGLPPGQYLVKVTSDSGASHTILTSGYTQSGDPDHWGTSGSPNDNQTTTPVILGPGDVFLDADFGYTPNTSAPVPTLGSIGNFVWLDRDADGSGPSAAGENQGNGAQNDSTEYGIGGVSVALIRSTNGDTTWDSGEPIIATMFTSDGTQDVDGDGTVDPVGFYRFRNLQVTDGTGTDDYIVVVTDVNNVLAGLRQTYDANDTGGPTTITTPNTSPVQNLSATAITTQDFGYTPDNSGLQASRTTLNLTANTGMLGNFVWFDVNGDGVGPFGNGNAGNNNTELGIPNVRVLLYDSTGSTLLATTYTGPDGYYLFPNLTAGNTSYVVRVDTTTLPGGSGAWTQTYDVDGTGTANQSTEAALADNEINLTHDFGYRGTGTTPGVDEGMIGDFIWYDLNADGDVDAGETGIPGVTVDLYYDQNGNGLIDVGEPKIATTTTIATAANIDGSAGNEPIGSYIFRGLPTNDGGNNAQYVVDVTDTAGVLAGYWHSLGTAGSNNNSQTDPYAVTLTTAAPSNRTADFGYYVIPAAIGNYVWYDTNGNGIQDSVEVGVNGVTVTLTIRYRGSDGALNTADDTVTTSTTITGDDPNTAGVQTGYYDFRNLLQDEDYNGAGSVEPTFTLTVSAPSGYITSPVNASGSTAFNDSNNSAGTTAAPIEGVTSVLSTDTTTTAPSYDFGFFRLTLSGKVWNDANNNGLLGAGENGINGVTVQLYKNNVLVATATTNSTGDYSFTQQTTGVNSGQPLAAGSDYTVRIPSGQVALNGLYSSTDVSTTANPTNTGNGTLNDDNGLGGGPAASNTFTTSNLTLNGTSVTNTAGSSADNSTGTTSQPTIYFGFTSTPTANELGDVTAKANADGTVSIRWETRNELNMIGFNVLRSDTKKGEPTTVNAHVIPARYVGQVLGRSYKYQDDTAAPDTTYFYRLEILRVNGSRSRTKPLKVTTPPSEACSGAPDASTLLTPTDGQKVKKGKVSFTWSAVSCAASYKWELRADTAEGAVVASKEGLTVTGTSIKKLGAGKKYYWQVWACDNDGECTASSVWQLQVRTAKKQTKPTTTP